MFPLPWNKAFRKKDGSITTLDDAISSGGGTYELPTASAQTKGGVKIGSGLTMEGEVLKNNNPTPFTLPIAGADTLGGIKVGSGLNINENGVLSASGGGGIPITPYEAVRLPDDATDYTFTNSGILTLFAASGTGASYVYFNYGASDEKTITMSTNLTNAHRSLTFIVKAGDKCRLPNSSVAASVVYFS